MHFQHVCTHHAWRYLVTKKWRPADTKLSKYAVLWVITSDLCMRTSLTGQRHIFLRIRWSWGLHKFRTQCIIARYRFYIFSFFLLLFIAPQKPRVFLYCALSALQFGRKRSMPAPFHRLTLLHERNNIIVSITSYARTPSHRSHAQP